jgi:HAD superfamily hydrolase (TIGR01509 family)
MIEAVIFDMDGLLIDSEPIWRRVHQEAYKTVGFEVSEKEMQTLMGTRLNEVVAYWYHKHPWKGPSQKDIEAVIVDSFIAAIKNEGQLQSGAYKVLEICKAAKLPMAIASSSSQEVIDVIVDTLRIRDFFDHLYSAENEPFGKPHPGAFLTTAGLLNTLPSNILVFEDSPFGVLAAKAAKMHCIAVPESDFKNHPYIQIADKVINSLEEFKVGTLAKV